MKKLLSLLVVLLVTITLAGCVSMGVDCDEQPDHETCLGYPVVNVLDELPQEDITITFWHVYGSSKGELLNDYIEEFQALYPNITIEAESKGGYDDLRTNTILAISSKSTPTMVVAYPDHVAGYLNGSIVVPLDEYIAHETWGIDLDDFIDSYVAENNQYKYGKMFSLAYSKSTEMMVINVDKFEANGITVGPGANVSEGENLHLSTTEPMDYTDIENFAEVVMGDGADKCEYFISYDSSANMFINNVRQWDGGYTNSLGEILIDNDNTRAMLTKMDEYFKAKIMAVPIVWNQDYASTNFKEQDVCLTVGSTAGISYNVPQDNAFEINVGVIPQYDEEHLSAVQQGPNVAVLGNSTDAERLAAWLFIKYITEAEQTSRWSMLTGYLPVSDSGYAEPKYQFFLDINNYADLDVHSLVEAYEADGTVDPSISTLITYYETVEDELIAESQALVDDGVLTEMLTVTEMVMNVYDDMKDFKYESMAANAAYLQSTYFEYDPAFSDKYTSSDARTLAEVCMEAIVAGKSVEVALNDMMYQLGVGE